ncbi:hypothetical protein DXG01_006598 [Tephrocybe rancida]|nr:hypothetical protein DXG01_006598 [Tephrocybe rancida]
MPADNDCIGQDSCTRVRISTALLGVLGDKANRTSESGASFLLPSIHSAPPFFTLVSQQPNPSTDAIAVEQWSQLLLAYARHRRLFFLRVEDAETADNHWVEALRNERINRMSRSSFAAELTGGSASGKVLPPYLSHILSAMVAKDLAAYEPQKQTRSVLLYWRSPDAWAETLHSWATETGQLNTIMTFYDITDPPIRSELTDMPIPLLRKAIGILGKTGRAQIIGVADGEGVRIFATGR